MQKLRSWLPKNYALCDRIETEISGSIIGTINYHKIPQKLFFVPHLLAHVQLASMIIETYIDRTYNDFKLDYIVNLFKKSLIYSMISELEDPIIPLIILATVFSFQILLVFYLLIATLLTQLWAQEKVKRLAIERQIYIINTVLHWYFTFYALFFMIMSSVAFSSITCSHRGIFQIQGVVQEECSQSLTQFLAYSITIIAYVHGVLVIYLHRNHRFAENNSLKRRFAYIQIVNQTISLGIVVFHFRQDIAFGDYLKYILANLYCLFTILDQFFSCPYRDPMRIPSIQIAFLLQWISIISTVYRFTSFISDESMFYWLTLPSILLMALSEAIASIFHEYALLNYNTGNGITEKYLILSVDQLYQYYMNYQQSDISKIGFLQLVLNHKSRCFNRKCHSKRKTFSQINFNDKIELHKFTLNIIKCIFKTAGQFIQAQHISNRTNFEQLQLQYISYLAEVVQKPLLGYIELRNYQNINQNNNSIYFQELTSKLAEQMESQILDLQSRMVKQTQQIFEQTSFVQEFSLTQLWKTINLYQQFLPIYVDIIDEKIQFWQALLDGYQNLNPYMENTLRLCQKVKNVHEKIKKDVNIPEVYFTMQESKGIKFVDSQNINILNLKLYSIYYSTIANDYDRAIYAEKYIMELIKDDRQKQSDIIDDQSLLQDDAVIILVSMVKNKGMICNNNLLTLCNFFKYTDIREFKEKTLISNFLPKDIQKIHDLLLDNFLQRGYSQFFVKKIHSYYVEQSGFLMPSYLKFSNLFQDQDDYVLTASLLKTNIEDDIIMFDGEGKIIGVSQKLYKNHIQRYSPNLTLEVFQEKGYIFLFFPQILSIIYQHQHVIQDLNMRFVNEQPVLLYINDDLQEMCIEFQNTQYQAKIDAKEQISSFNISTWRSRVSNRVINEAISMKMSQKLQELDEVNNGKILGVPIPLLNHDKASIYLDFCNQYFKERMDHSVIRVKLSLQYRAINVKEKHYPYFLMEVNFVNTYDQNLVKSSRLVTIERAIDRVRQGITGQQKSLNKFDDIQITESKNNNMTQDSMWDAKNSKDQEQEFQTEKNYQENVHNEEEEKQENQEEKKEKQKQKQNKFEKMISNVEMDNNENSVTPHPDISLNPEISANVSMSRQELINKSKAVDVNDLPSNKPQFFNPQIDIDFNEEDEIGFIQQEFDLIEDNKEELQKQKSKEVQKGNENDGNEKEIDIEHIDELEMIKSSTLKNNGQKKEGKDILELLQENKLNLEHKGDDFQQKQSSKASSSKTTSSKSPFLLIRNMYTQSQFTGNILFLAFANAFMIAMILILLFVKSTIVQNNYDILQKNIYYVQYPETLNYYFVKITMLSWVLMEQDIDLIDYSPFINKQIYEEMKQIRSDIDIQMMKLYQDIILYEDDVLKEDIPFQIINNLQSFKVSLDLTLVIEQFTSHALNFIDSIDELVGKNNAINPNIGSDVLFFRLNLPSINRFSKIFVTFLNTNLVYYEDSIISAITLLVVAEISTITLLFFYQIRLWQRIHSYNERVLILTTRLHSEQAQQWIVKLRQVKEILSEQSQKEWKQTNYAQQLYENSNRRLQDTEFNLNQTKSASSVSNKNSKSKQRIRNRSLQNSSLTYRIYNLNLSQKINYLILALIWLLLTTYLLGVILLSIDQISQIKPTLNLNLQIIEFKLQFDSLVVQSEILKTDEQVEMILRERIYLHNIEFERDFIVENFQQTYFNFQKFMSKIYSELSSSPGLQESQKNELLQPFETNLCLLKKEEIPFCQIQKKADTDTIDDYVTKDFIDKYGYPFPQDDNYEYISGGIVHMVHEFVKTITQFYYDELHKDDETQTMEEKREQVVQYLNSTSHITQFLQHFTDQGKLLSDIGFQLLYFNRNMLNLVMFNFRVYIFTAGIMLIAIISIFIIIWIKRLVDQLSLIKLALINIPYDNLLEAKTISVIKALENI